MAKQLKKNTRYRILIGIVISFIFIVYFVVSILYYSVNVANLNKEKQKLNASLKELQTKEVELSSEIEKLKDPDYVARYARENYLYSKDGEYIIKIDRDKKKLDSGEGKSSPINMSEEVVLISAGGLSVVILLGTIIKKSRGKEKKK